MGIFDRLFNKNKKSKKYIMTQDGFTPVFSQFGTDIYASDVVQQALTCIVEEMKKLKPSHIRMIGQDPVPINSDMQRVLNDPNPLMTTAEFIEKCVWLLLLNYNLFIVPTYEEIKDRRTGQISRRCTALYPIKPTTVDFVEDASGKMFVTFRFPNGYESTLPYENVIHVRYHYAINDFMGGDSMGQPDHKALLETLDLNKQLLTGIAKSMNASYAVNGVVKYNTMLDDGQTEKALAELEKKLRNNESGILPIDIKADFIPIARNTQLIDETTLKFIDEKILRNWRISLAILTGDYTKEQYEAFYQACLEPLIIAFSQAFTKKMFTDRERSYGNKIEFYPKDLIFMTVSQTLEMINVLSPTGALMENEKRVALGLRPLPELEGKRFMSLNWIDANDAKKYQTGQEEKKQDDENEE